MPFVRTHKNGQIYTSNDRTHKIRVEETIRYAHFLIEHCRTNAYMKLEVAEVVARLINTGRLDAGLLQYLLFHQSKKSMSISPLLQGLVRTENEEDISAHRDTARSTEPEYRDSPDAYQMDQKLEGKVLQDQDPQRKAPETRDREASKLGKSKKKLKRKKRGGFSGSASDREEVQRTSEKGRDIGTASEINDHNKNPDEVITQCQTLVQENLPLSLANGHSPEEAALDELDKIAVEEHSSNTEVSKKQGTTSPQTPKQQRIESQSGSADENYYTPSDSIMDQTPNTPSKRRLVASSLVQIKPREAELTAEQFALLEETVNWEDVQGRVTPVNVTLETKSNSNAVTPTSASTAWQTSLEGAEGQVHDTVSEIDFYNLEGATMRSTSDAQNGAIEAGSTDWSGARGKIKIIKEMKRKSLPGNFAGRFTTAENALLDAGLEMSALHDKTVTQLSLAWDRASAKARSAHRKITREFIRTNSFKRRKSSSPPATDYSISPGTEKTGRSTSVQHASSEKLYTIHSPEVFSPETPEIWTSYSDSNPQSGPFYHGQSHLLQQLPGRIFRHGTSGLLWAYKTGTPTDERLAEDGIWLWKKPTTYFKPLPLACARQSDCSSLLPVIICQGHSDHSEPIYSFDGRNVFITPHATPWRDERSHVGHPDFLVPWKLAIYQACEAAGYWAYRHDRIFLPCRKFGCGRDLSDHDPCTIVCRGCGPKSEIRYCSLQHQIEDIYHHREQCGSPDLVLRYFIDNDSAPEHFNTIYPAIKERHGHSSGALYLQRLHAMINGGYYTLFDPQTQQPMTLSWPRSEPKWQAMDRRIERLLNIAFFDASKRNTLAYLYCLLRTQLYLTSGYSPAMFASLRTQFGDEFGQAIFREVEHRPYVECECRWAGTDLANGAHKPKCEWRFPEKAQAKGAMNHGVEQTVKSMEAESWILRAWQTQHLSVSDPQERIEGQGFPDVRKGVQVRMGPGFDGWGAEPDNTCA